MAIGVIHGGSVEFFHGHGFEDINSETPITEHTVFRIGSITKTFTSMAVMQLWEEGLVDLDAPANDYLRAFRLIPAQMDWRAATLRHLLTHTAGIPDVLRVVDLLHPSWGPFFARPPVPSVPVGEPLPSLAEYYRDGIRLVTEPGTAFAYSGHGFATLGQVVEDVSGEPLDRYFREHIFEQLGMSHTDLVRSERVKAHLATGYVLGRRGPEPVPDREWLGKAGGGIYSSSRDLFRYAAALLGANEHGSILQPETLAMMFERHHSPDPRLVAMGLGFFRHDLDGHRIVGHDGLLPGFNSSLLVAPDDGLAVFGFTNGSSGATLWLPDEMAKLLQDLLAIPDPMMPSDIPQHPELWRELCGVYRLPPVGDLRGRLMMAGGARVLVRDGQLKIRLLAPIPAMYNGFPLHPDNENDPYVFRIDLSGLGLSPVRLVFDCRAGPGRRSIHTDLGGQPISLIERPTFPRLRAARTRGDAELPQ
ncbi:MAG TPA: serine hydrolase domain-containing protein [Acidimicrobiia bacterium]|nr:serine hydrolase domain-containing protein [Acidimicrobiia bacterium]